MTVTRSAHRSAALLPALLALGLAAPAFAQSSPTSPTQASPTQASPTQAISPAPAPAAPMAATSTPKPGVATPGHHAGPQGASMAEMVEHRITDLHGKLKITPAQSTQWDAFAQVMRANARDVDAAFAQRAAKLASLSAVDNMKSYADIEQTRAQDMQKLVASFQDLYGVLSDSQKQAADQLFRNVAQVHEQRRSGPAAHHPNKS